MNPLQETLNQFSSKNCIIEVIGLGYVGFPLSLHLASGGLNVIGIDTNLERITRLNQNKLMESELNLSREFEKSRKNQNLIFSDKPKQTDTSKIGIICVPTPIGKNSVDSNIYVFSAVENFLSTCKTGDLIILESSIEVGTTDKIKKLIEKKGFEVGKNFGLCFCPERIDPQNKKWNLKNIPRVIYCSDEFSYEIAKKLYYYINNSNLFRVNNAKIAEVVKSYENAFRLVNISLVNELAVLCDKLEINVSDVINAAATKPFGFMPFYTGSGVGGHCIPKDPTFLSEASKKFGIEFKTIENALEINSFMPKYVVNSIDNLLDELKLEKSVIVCGLSYKPDIEDMRDSPGFKILNEFQKKQFKVAGYDPFFKMELFDKYLIENNLLNKKFEILEDLSNEKIKNFNCICVVQHHTEIELKINEIYKNSFIPLIYDCQNKMKKLEKSTTILKSLGS